MYIVQKEGKIIFADEVLQNLENTLKCMPDNEKMSIEEVSEASVVKAYDGCFYLAGYAPEKPAKELAQEKIAELKAQLVASDYVANKLIEAYALNDMELFEMYRAKYKDKIEERKEMRANIDELEEMING